MKNDNENTIKQINAMLGEEQASQFYKDIEDFDAFMKEVPLIQPNSKTLNGIKVAMRNELKHKKHKVFMHRMRISAVAAILLICFGVFFITNPTLQGTASARVRMEWDDFDNINNINNQIDSMIGEFSGTDSSSNGEYENDYLEIEQEFETLKSSIWKG